MKNIVLIGFMGSGKTTIGKKLSEKYNLKFIDMDEEIEKEINMSISDIFRIYGEKYFRKKEVELLNKLLNKENIIISTGGGIIESKEAIEILRKQKNVIWLNASEDTIINRVTSELDKRPKLSRESNLKITIQNLLGDRYSKYEKVANINIDVNNKNIDEVISEILVYDSKNMLL